MGCGDFAHKLGFRGLSLTFENAAINAPHIDPGPRLGHGQVIGAKLGSKTPATGARTEPQLGGDGMSTDPKTKRNAMKLLMFTGALAASCSVLLVTVALAGPVGGMVAELEAQGFTVTSIARVKNGETEIEATRGNEDRALVLNAAGVIIEDETEVNACDGQAHTAAASKPARPAWAQKLRCKLSRH